MPTKHTTNGTKEFVCAICGTSHDIMVFHSKCHPEAPMFVLINKDHTRVQVRCAVCARDVVEITGIIKLEGKEPDEQSATPLWVIYNQAHNVVTLSCAECDQTIAKLHGPQRENIKQIHDID